MDKEQKTRLKRLLAGFFSIVAAGLIYYILIKIIGKGLDCPIKAVTGKFCPGCGITRMCMALIEGDIKSAVKYNLLLMSLIPVFLIFGPRRAYLYVKKGESEPDKTESIVICIVFVLTVAFWIMRNTEKFSFLAPIA